mgnify:CR=1 FL=1
MRKAFVFLSLIVALFLGIALAYQIFLWEPEQRKTVALTEAIPAEMPGWKVQDVPLADSEEMEARVEGILNFSEALFRTYTKPGTELAVYVAYWEPRKMPVRLVQAHTPDICWVRAGWEVEDSRYSVPLSAMGVPLKPAEYRVMTKDPALQYVYYWHVVGDEIYINRSIGVWDRWDPIKSLFRFGLNQQQEQFFVRVSSNRPVDEIWDDPDVQKIMRDLAELALAKPEAALPAPIQG